ncbi:hypothetical protein MHU86_720 [Fragilaria crotonensis]|nr:hypothetical protein MHU86_720 [Fragilaria crotonensis]
MYSVARTSSLTAIASRAAASNSASAGRRVLNSTSKRFKASVSESIGKESAAAMTATSRKVVGESWAKRNQFAFQLGVATAKTMAADLLTQTVAEGKTLAEVDLQRNFIFVLFGFGYLGCFQYWLMVTKYRQWFPTMDRFAKLSVSAKLKDTAGILDAMKMVLFDIVVHLPVIYFPCYYTIKELVVGKTWNPVDWLQDGITKYSINMKDDLTAMIKLWGPSDCIQFVLPIHIRMPFRHMVSFFWTAYISFTRGSVQDTEPIELELAGAALMETSASVSDVIPTETEVNKIHA